MLLPSYAVLLSIVLRALLLSCVTCSYNGHIFWDELWIGQGIAMMQPELAAALVQYRFERLAGARHKATTYDPPYRGAMMPWESALTGGYLCR